MSRAVTTVTKLPRRATPPIPEHSTFQDYDLDNVSPYVFDGAVKSMQLQLSVHAADPRPGTTNLLDFYVGIHCHGVSQTSGRPVHYPFVCSAREGLACPIAAMQLNRNLAETTGGLEACHRVVWTADLARIPLGVACVLVTVSSTNLHAIRLIRTQLAWLPPHRKEWDPPLKTLGHRNIAASQITSLNTCGTIVIGVLARHGAWWHLHSTLSYAPAATPAEFTETICRAPHGRSGPARVAALLKVIEMYYPETRKVRIWVARADNLAVRRTPLSARLLCTGQGGSRPVYTLRTNTPALPGGGYEFDRTSPAKSFALLREVEWDIDDGVGHVVFEGTLASDPRHMVLIMRHASRTHRHPPRHNGVPDPDFLGAVEMDIAQLWNLLPTGQARCELDLRLPLHRQEGAQAVDVSGTVTFNVHVSKEDFKPGVDFLTDGL